MVTPSFLVICLISQVFSIKLGILIVIFKSLAFKCSLYLVVVMCSTKYSRISVLNR